MKTGLIIYLERHIIFKVKENLHSGVSPVWIEMKKRGKTK